MNFQEGIPNPFEQNLDLERVRSRDISHNKFETDMARHINVRDHILLVRAMDFPEKQGSIIIPEHYREDAQVSLPMGRVIKMGSGCFDDKNKFPLGARCQLGDWIDYNIMERRKVSLFSTDEDMEISKRSLYYYIYDESVLSEVPMNVLPYKVEGYNKYFNSLTN